MDAEIRFQSGTVRPRNHYLRTILKNERHRVPF